MKKLGVLSDHDELLVPTQRSFARFFDIASREGVLVEALTDARVEAGLVGYDAVLLGAPRKPVPAATIASLRVYLEAGGRLLITAEAGGDASPWGRTNLSDVVPGLAFGNDVVGFSTTMYAYENTVLTCPADAIARRLRGKSLPFVTGCTLRLSGERAPLVTLRDALDNEGTIVVFPAPQLEDADTLTMPDGPSIAFTQPLYAELAYGADARGLVIACGSTLGFHDDYVDAPAYTFRAAWGRPFLDHVLFRLLHRGFGEELDRRLREPQRHRLLQGYPMPKLMLPQPAPPPGSPAAPRPPSLFERSAPEAAGSLPGTHRTCIVGVLPHAFCNPTVRGCGFCTFPQEKLSRERLPVITEAVRASIEAYRGSLRGARRPTPALYFGGGTANLTPPDVFAALCREIAQTFDLSGSEITLEGVPRYFGIQDHALLHVLRDVFPEAHPRISMGVQTFDRSQLERMGRTGFGDRDEIERLVRDAHDRGFSVSCDLLINLPGQTLGEMIDDVEIAAGAGFDQICVYHLVLFEGMGTAWSEDRSLLARMNDNPRAFANQRRCRKRLYELGFTQTTLTNFERKASAFPRFQYEPRGFQPDRCDLLGFGPAAINLAAQRDFRGAWKTVRAQESDAFLRGEARGIFFDEDDMRLLFLTRSIALLSIDTGRYRTLFGHDVFDDYGGELEALLGRGLVRDRGERLDLSPEGMFYADAVAGLLAWRRVQIIRDRPSHESKQVSGKKIEPILRFHDPNVPDYGGMG